MSSQQSPRPQRYPGSPYIACPVCGSENAICVRRVYDGDGYVDAWIADQRCDCNFSEEQEATIINSLPPPMTTDLTPEKITKLLSKVERELADNAAEYGHDPKCGECKLLKSLLAALRQLQREKQELEKKTSCPNCTMCPKCKCDPAIICQYDDPWPGCSCNLKCHGL